MRALVDRLFPQSAGNDFRGQPAAIGLFVPLLLLKLTIGVNSILRTESVATTADRIPLAGFAGGGAETVVALFALGAVTQTVLALVGLVVLLRYRALLPLMYLAFLVEYLGRKGVAALHPIVRSGPSAAGPIGGILGGLIVGGFALALLPRRAAPDA